MHTRNALDMSVQIPGWLLLIYLVYAQGIAAFDYDLGISMGTQESAAVIGEVGVAFWRGFAIGDLVVYIPLLLAGLLGFQLQRRWGTALLAAALGITVYWPITVLAAAVAARGAQGWLLESELEYWLVLVPITLWAVWGLTWLCRRARIAS